MNAALFVIACCLDLLGTLSAVPLWYFMIRRRFLHANFRTISLLATIGVQFANVFSLVFLVSNQFGYDTQVLYISLKPITRYGGLLFYVGNFFLGIERAVAVLMVSKYEKCVSPLITSAIIVVTASVAGLTGTALNMLVAIYSVVPKLVFVIAYATLCFLIAISLQVYRRAVQRITHGSSLQKNFCKKESYEQLCQRAGTESILTNTLNRLRDFTQSFQHKENGRTVQIYTCISANELVSSVAILSMYALEGKAESNSDAGMVELTKGFVEVIDGYRILFINAAILYNWYVWKRTQKRITVDDHGDGDQYFRQLQMAWDNEDCLVKTSSASGIFGTKCVIRLQNVLGPRRSKFCFCLK